jgi:hypothetical protein
VGDELLTPPAAPAAAVRRIPAGIGLTWLHLRTRRVPAAVLALAVCGALLHAALHWHWTFNSGPYAQQVPLIIKACAAATIAVTAHSPFGETERSAGRWLPYLRLLAAVGLTGLAILALQLGAAGESLNGGQACHHPMTPLRERHGPRPQHEQEPPHAPWPRPIGSAWTRAGQLPGAAGWPAQPGDDDMVDRGRTQPGRLRARPPAQPRPQPQRHPARTRTASHGQALRPCQCEEGVQQARGAGGWWAGLVPHPRTQIRAICATAHELA